MLAWPARRSAVPPARLLVSSGAPLDPAKRCTGIALSRSAPLSLEGPTWAPVVTPWSAVAGGAEPVLPTRGTADALGADDPAITGFTPAGRCGDTSSTDVRPARPAAPVTSLSDRLERIPSPKGRWPARGTGVALAARDPPTMGGGGVGGSEARGGDGEACLSASALSRSAGMARSAPAPGWLA